MFMELKSYLEHLYDYNYWANKRYLAVAESLTEEQLLRKQGHADKARAVGQQLLDRFPDHVATREAVGDLCLETKDLDGAVTHFEAALKANPLERRLRGNAPGVVVCRAGPQPDHEHCGHPEDRAHPAG